MRVMAHVEPHPKSGVFQFRRRIPTDLQVVLGRKTHYESLKTKDRRLANQRGAEADARFEAILKDARERLALANGHEHAGAAPPEPEQAPPPLLSPTAANEALTRWKQAEIGKAVLAAFNGLLDMNGLGDEAHRRSERIHRLGQPNPWDHIPDFHARLVAALASQGMRVRPDHPALGWLLIPFRDAWLEVERAISKMVMGQLDPATLHVQAQPAPSNAGTKQLTLVQVPPPVQPHWRACA
jgi:hypothetical protein